MDVREVDFKVESTDAKRAQAPHVALSFAKEHSAFLPVSSQFFPFLPIFPVLPVSFRLFCQRLIFSQRVSWHQQVPVLANGQPANGKVLSLLRTFSAEDTILNLRTNKDGEQGSLTSNLQTVPMG